MASTELLDPYVVALESDNSDNLWSRGADVTNSSTPSSTPPSITHDTSRTQFHLKDLDCFAKCLENSVKRAFPTSGPHKSRYTSVKVLLLMWEDDELGVDNELDGLHQVFTNYGFDTETWLIPSDNPHLELTIKAADFVKKYEGEDCLLIVYYGGHAAINAARQSSWYCKNDPQFVSISLEWSAIQTVFEKAISDVLLLLDCCGAASAAPIAGRAITETIAACGWEAIAPIPGRWSFTAALIEVLEDWIENCFSVAMLHSQVLSVLKHPQPERSGNKRRKVERRRTPVYIHTSSRPGVPSINLSRLKTKTILDGGSAFHVPSISGKNNISEIENANITPPGYNVKNITGCQPTGLLNVPHILISIALLEDQELDLKPCSQWLGSFPALAKYATVQGVYKSHSILVIASVPVIVWDLLPENLACSFIGYIASDNLLEHEEASKRSMEKVNIQDVHDFGLEHSLFSTKRISQSRSPRLETSRQLEDKSSASDVRRSYRRARAMISRIDQKRISAVKVPDQEQNELRSGVDLGGRQSIAELQLMKSNYQDVVRKIQTETNSSVNSEHPKGLSVDDDEEIKAERQQQPSSSTPGNPTTSMKHEPSEQKLTTTAFMHDQEPSSEYHELIIRQQPVRAKAFIGEERDKKPIDPPPIVQLRRLRRLLDPPQNYLHDSYFVVCSLLAEHSIPPGNKPVEIPNSLDGTRVSTLLILKDIDNSEGHFFCFGDLLVKFQGVFKLRFALYETSSKGATYITSVSSTSFTVYASKDWPGMPGPTFLTRSFRDQGVDLKLKLKARVRLHTPGTKSKSDIAKYQPQSYGTKPNDQSQQPLLDNWYNNSSTTAPQIEMGSSSSPYIPQTYSKSLTQPVYTGARGHHYPQMMQAGYYSIADRTPQIEYYSIADSVPRPAVDDSTGDIEDTMLE